MLVVFKSAFTKSLRLKSTWIVLLVGSILTLIIAGVLPFQINRPETSESEAVDQMKRIQFSDFSAIASYAIIGTVLMLITAVFAGFRGATVFRDEIEDGSFLVIVSKPINRYVLIITKWIAFSAILFIFSLIMAIMHAFGVLIGSQATLPAKLIFIGIGMEWAIGIIFSLIYGSIALLLSTFMTATATAATTLIFGIVPVLTNLIQPMTSAPRYKSDLSSYSISDFYRAQVPINDSDHYQVNVPNNDYEDYKNINADTVAFRNETDQEIVERIGGSITKFLKSATSESSNITYPVYVILLLKYFDKMGIIYLPSFLADINVDKGLLNIISDMRNIPDGLLDKYLISKEFLVQITKITAFFSSKMYYDSKKNDPFEKLVPFDFGLQASILSTYVTDAVYSKDYVNAFINIAGGKIITEQWKRVSAVKLSADIFDNQTINYSFSNKPIYSSMFLIDYFTMPALAQQNGKWGTYYDENNLNRKLLNNIFNNRQHPDYYTVQYEPYVKRSTILAIYLSITIVLIPLSIAIISRKNFA